MEKIRVYELAKELNTTSKRLMEKLAEINVVVKNHMSLLEDNELQSLYKHIGVVKHEDNRHEDNKRTAAPAPQPKHEVAKDGKKDAKSAPRIIRTTEIVIDSKNEANTGPVQKHETPRSDTKIDNRNNQRSNNNKRNDYVRVADANSGLRAGYVRDTGVEARKDPRTQVWSEDKKEQPKAPVKTDQPKEAKPEVRPETKQEPKQEIKKEIGEDINTVVNSTASIEQKVDKGSLAVETKTEEVKNAPLAGDRENKGQEQHGDSSSRNVQQGQREFRNDTRPEWKKDRFDRPRNQDGNYAEKTDGNGPSGQHGGDRPQGGRYDNRQGGDRPQGGNYGNRQWGDRPQGGNYENRQGGDRPQGGNYGNRQWGDRPQGGNYGNRQGGDRPQGGNYGNRQGGDRPQGGGNYGNRQGGYRPPQRNLEIPKLEMTEAQKEEMNSIRNEMRREFQNKDVDKDVKRDQKKDVPKAAPGAKNERFKPHKVMLGQKKGVNEVLSEDFILNEFYTDDGAKKIRKGSKPKRGYEPVQYNAPKIAVLTSITIGETITVKELAESLKKTATDVIKKLMGLGVMATLNQELDFDTAALIADEFGVKTEKAVVVNEEDILFDDSDDVSDHVEPRPPVVVVMGHVDHGKTSLLDAIRETHVMDMEAGGITQHIGAYMVKINDRNITFLDTPGHEAFTAMRARGAQVTDIAILVVAADDGVMPQTIEAINHAKAANVSIIVAINKIDKPGANPDRVKQELTEYGIVAEEWGGDAIMVPVSAKKRENIDQLLEMVLLAADMLELKADPNRQAKGTIIEAKLDKGRGPVATVLVQRGTLNIGDSIVTGTTVGRIRAMTDDKGQAVKKAGPSTPVEILGLPEVPEAGEIFYAITDEKVAKQLAEKRKFKQREQHLKASAKVSLEDLFTQIKEGKVKDLNIIVKADVQGSVEAVKQSLEKLSNEEVRVKTIHGGVGAITESDVSLAQVSNAIIIGFNVRPGTNVAEVAKEVGVDLRLYRVIYNAIEDVQAAMKGMLEPTFKEVILGHAEIRQLFKVSGIGTIAGSYVTDGKIVRNSEIRVVRSGIVVHEGKLASLKRFKDDAKEVAHGFECGLSIEKFNDIKEGDIVESYVMEEVAR